MLFLRYTLREVESSRWRGESTEPGLGFSMSNEPQIRQRGRRLLAKCSLVALLLLALPLGLLIADSVRVDGIAARWPLVRVGQTRQEIIALLGEPNTRHPARDDFPILGDVNETWGYGRRCFRVSRKPPFVMPKLLELELFTPDADRFSLEFDREGTVVVKFDPASEE